jgi:hypothetical protein
VKVFAIIAIALVVAFVILMIAGGHGPSRHLQGAGTPHGDTQPEQHLTEKIG